MAISKKQRRELDSVLHSFAGSIASMEKPALMKLAPILVKAQAEIEKDLKDWLARQDGSDRFTTHKLRLALLQMRRGLDTLKKIEPAMYKGLVFTADTAGDLSTAMLEKQVLLLNHAFGGELKPLDIDTAAAMTRADKLLISQFESSAKRYSGDVKKRLVQEIAVGVARGETIDQMARRLEKSLPHVFGAIKNSAERVVRTEAMHAYNTYHATQIGELAKQDDGIRMMWDAYFDKRTCAHCASLHGKAVEIGASFDAAWEAHGGKEMKATHEQPPAHPNCRCVLVAWHENWSEMKPPKDVAKAEKPALPEKPPAPPPAPKPQPPLPMPPTLPKPAPAPAQPLVAKPPAPTKAELKAAQEAKIAASKAAEKAAIEEIQKEQAAKQALINEAKKKADEEWAKQVKEAQEKAAAEAAAKKAMADEVAKAQDAAKAAMDKAAAKAKKEAETSKVSPEVLDAHAKLHSLKDLKKELLAKGGAHENTIAYLDKQIDKAQGDLTAAHQAAVQEKLAEMAAKKEKAALLEAQKKHGPYGAPAPSPEVEKQEQYVAYLEKKQANFTASSGGPSASLEAQIAQEKAKLAALKPSPKPATKFIDMVPAKPKQPEPSTATPATKAKKVPEHYGTAWLPGETAAERQKRLARENGQRYRAKKAGVEIPIVPVPGQEPKRGDRLTADDLKVAAVKSKFGHAIDSDGDKVEGHTVNVRQVITAGGSEAFEFNFKVTGEHGDAAKASFMAAGGALEYGDNYRKTGWTYAVRSPNSKGQLVESSERSVSVGDRLTMRKTIQGTTVEVDYGVTGATYNSVRIRVLSGDPAMAMKAFDEISRGLGVNEATKRPTKDDIRLQAKAQVLAKLSPRTWSEMAGKKIDEAKIDAAIKRSGDKVAEMAVEDAVKKKVYNGRESLFSEAIAEDVRKAGIKEMQHDASSNLPTKTVKSILTDTGLMSSAARYEMGVFTKGMSTTEDFRTGGADGVFMRIRRGRSVTEGGAGWRFVLDAPQVLGRLDWWAYNADQYGSTSPKMVSKRWSLTAMKGGESVNTGNEVMAPRGVAPTAFKRVYAPSRQARDELLAELRASGTSHINGVPIEDFVKAR